MSGWGPQRAGLNRQRHTYMSQGQRRDAQENETKQVQEDGQAGEQDRREESQRAESRGKHPRMK